MGVQRVVVEDPGHGSACEECSAPIRQSVTGRRRKTCSDACRQARWRRAYIRDRIKAAIKEDRAARGVPVDEEDVDATAVTAEPAGGGHITADRSGTDHIVSEPVRGLGDGRPRPIPVDQTLWLYEDETSEASDPRPKLPKG